MFNGATDAGADDAVLMDSWDADEQLMESWDAEEKPVGTKPIPAAKKAPAKATTNKKKTDKKASNDKVLMEIDTLDEKTRKELLKKAELESDLNNAADLFAGLGVAEEHPKAKLLRREQEESLLMQRASLTKDTPIENHPLFVQAETKTDYQELRKALGVAVTSMNEKSSLNYTSSLAIDLIRDVAKPLSIESIRQTVATLNALIKEKERQERQSRLARVKGGTATGGAGKKKTKTKVNLGGAFKKNEDLDMSNMDDFDFGDDDFM
ncbi:hypothetical protein TBLA_0C05050 [Henningerozyma blattae CBS 6284]|uniref:Eukaryotic translation initiation factor 3 subunit J n=1 Tax=Henningerozyma blattae (strain ATCC 34711 / CBS 6284 / DSM 70876 / NBRC 10599 / NRRL Y-10934 / UCD 77-7) TaxID=1071380 RepID=I2H1P9_HENB6|nr:hypothetical protein TBLA_0C05050 [Tetrapisispora blattae CBS 6284]CCH60301.1 hypothetical protein TBLA_0C05050 [Tetrapisispora blattae CBS 6284]